MQSKIFVSEFSNKLSKKLLSKEPTGIITFNNTQFLIQLLNTEGVSGIIYLITNQTNSNKFVAKIQKCGNIFNTVGYKKEKLVYDNLSKFDPLIQNFPIMYANYKGNKCIIYMEYGLPLWPKLVEGHNKLVEGNPELLISLFEQMIMSVYLFDTLTPYKHCDISVANFIVVKSNPDVPCFEYNTDLGLIKIKNKGWVVKIIDFEKAVKNTSKACNLINDICALSEISFNNYYIKNMHSQLNTLFNTKNIDLIKSLFTNNCP